MLLFSDDLCDEANNTYKCLSLRSNGTVDWQSFNSLSVLLYICDLVKLHVAFFSVLPFMVNKDEY